MISRLIVANIAALAALLVEFGRSEPNYECWQGLQVKPVIDSGMYPVYFGSIGSYGYPSFSVNLYNNEVGIVYTDCYCPGDNFVILDNGKVMRDTTSAIPSCTPSTSNCASYLSDPASCVNSATYCRSTASNFYVSKDAPHNITVLTTDSPFGRGLMWIGFYNNTGSTRICTSGNKCYFGISPYVNSVYPVCNPNDSVDSSTS